MFSRTACADEPTHKILGRKLADELRRSGLVYNERVLQAVQTTPRHRFVPPGVRHQAYFDMALPIGFQQTISSPLIVAQMTQELDPQPTDRVLEIGTGSGYQAAILSPLAHEIYSIEIVEPLGQRAMHTLKQLNYRNVFVRIGDGYQGWSEKAPFDKIIVTCSPHDIPQPLVDQLREGGKMVIPVGERYQQVLYLLEKINGKLERTALLPTLFVPMTGTADASRPASADPSTVNLVNGNFETTSLIQPTADPAAPPEPLPLQEPDQETTAPTKRTTENRPGIPGWYYEQQVETVETEEAPEGRRLARFENLDPGRSAHLLQGLGLDGRRIQQVHLAAKVRVTGVVSGVSPDLQAAIVITFYDQDRRELGRQWLGPWQGTHSWSTVRESFPVPEACREAILRVGLFGATGQFDVDAITLSPSL
ncbi:MAG: protein-L-isoaspartate(D-aspartate) O-methyltransferase [Planctomycetota bacterium]|nr:protein-L-isoaspartate(D-aspartate) O-methyltransferase [Planctomycetota bacterium]MDA1178493.1 protein-L-isoaspartate(D-aspartate) O-methyltransferase [Planctomycetota bacterium]